MRLALPVMVGNEIINFALDNWDKQGYMGMNFEPWQERKDPQPGRAILVGKQSGRMRRSNRITRQNPGSVTVANEAPYAGIHNTGGIITVSVTDRSRRFFWAMYYQTGDERWKGMALTDKKQFNIRIPKRQFIGDSPELRKRIKKLVELQLKKAFGS